MTTIYLGDIAYTRSGDKGEDANIGVIALRTEDYSVLERYVTAAAVADYLKPLGASRILCYKLPNLGALNFVCKGILAGGASHSLRSDTQGKALGQALLHMKIDILERP